MFSDLGVELTKEMPESHSAAVAVLTTKIGGLPDHAKWCDIDQQAIDNKELGEPRKRSGSVEFVLRVNC